MPRHPFLRPPPPPRRPSVDPSLMAALDVLRSVAAADPDRASRDNGQGFSKADCVTGHRLARLSPDAVAASPATAAAVKQMAARYRRQAPAGLAWAAELTPQRDLFG